jgi:hypothetical protein
VWISHGQEAAMARLVFHRGALGIIFLQQMWALNQKIEVIPYSQ